MNAFSKYHPAALMVYFVSVLLIAMFAGNPILELCALFGGLLFCMTLTSRKEKRSDAGFYLLLFLLITATNPLFSHNGETPLFFLNGNAVTQEAFVYGAATAVMMIAVMLWCKAYSYVMTGDKFIFLFGRAIPQLSLILTVALRYIPMLKRQSEKITRAQKAMGLYASESYFDRLRSSLCVFSALIGWSLENAVETGHSMQARGYGLRGRTHYSDYRFGSADGILLGVSVGLLLLTGYGIAAGYTDFTCYPRVQLAALTPAACAVYIGFLCLSLLPFMIEVEENIRWIYYRSKI